MPAIAAFCLRASCSIFFFFSDFSSTSSSCDFGPLAELGPPLFGLARFTAKFSPPPASIFFDLTTIWLCWVGLLRLQLHFLLWIALFSSNISAELIFCSFFFGSAEGFYSSLMLALVEVEFLPRRCRFSGISTLQTFLQWIRILMRISPLWVSLMLYHFSWGHPFVVFFGEANFSFALSSIKSLLLGVDHLLSEFRV